MRQTIRPTSELFSELPHSEDHRTTTTSTKKKPTTQQENKWEGLEGNMIQNISLYPNQYRSENTNVTSSLGGNKQQQTSSMRSNVRAQDFDSNISPSQGRRRVPPTPPRSESPRVSADASASPGQVRHPSTKQQIM